MSHTPPHRPTYDVRLSRDRVESIVKVVFPAHDVTSVEQLESGKSYNNRIYFIQIAPSEAHTETQRAPQSLVLKLAGHFFDFKKIENELGCLLLLRKYCNIPVPEPFAWSAGGKSIETVDGRSIDTEGEHPFSEHAWILTSRLPGRVLTVMDLDSKHGNAILKQLAKHVTAWRTQIPKSRTWGNLRIKPAQSDAEAFTGLIPNKTFTLDAFLLNTYYWPNSLRYYHVLSRDQLSRLNKETVFARTKERHAVEWDHWVQNDLPSYRLSHYESCVLTHFDFSPRNILIAYNDGVPTVTGVLDFEFTGFFPPEEEFLNAMVRQDSDWEERHWDVMMQEMAKLGQKVPPTPDAETEMCFDEVEWQQSRIIAKMIDRIAPWEIMEGKFEEKELKRKLDEAAQVVNEGIRKLSLMKSQQPETMND
jgi:Phosphotransferase enzyme family